MAARERERAQVSAVRQHNAAVRHAEQAQRDADRAQAQYVRASEAERKRLEKEARAAHVEAREAEVAERNLDLAQVYDDIDSLLSATLATDDYVDIEMLRVPADHPPFDRTDLEVSIPPPSPIPDPAEPVFVPRAAPSGLGGLFGKKKHAESVAADEADHEAAVARWRADLEDVAKRRVAAAAVGP